MKIKSGSILGMFRQAFSAFSYEHSSEMLSTKHKMKVLSKLPEDNTLANNEKLLSGRILLSVEKYLDPTLLKYSVGAAKQFNACIDILSAQNYDDIQKIMKKELGGSSVNWRLIKLEKELKSGITDYTNNHSDVLFMVTDQHELLSANHEKSRYAA